MPTEMLSWGVVALVWGAMLYRWGVKAGRRRQSEEERRARLNRWYSVPTGSLPQELRQYLMKVRHYVEGDDK